MMKDKEQDTVVSMIFDSWDRYLNRYYNEEWADQGPDMSPYRAQLNVFLTS